MLNILLIWISIGIIVAYYKISQSKKFGFNKKIKWGNIHYVIIGVILWPILIIYIYNEKKTHKEAYLQSLLYKSKFDQEMNEIEKDLDL